MKLQVAHLRPVFDPLETLRQLHSWRNEASFQLERDAGQGSARALEPVGHTQAA